MGYVSLEKNKPGKDTSNFTVADLKRINLISGKGGVGRSTFAATFAKAAANAGKKTLLAEIEDDTGADSPLARTFNLKHFSTEPAKIDTHLYGLSLSAVTGQERFLNSFLKITTLTKTILGNQGIRWFLEGAPAFKEMGYFNHLLMQLREDYEVIILDLPATGHLVGLARLPRILLKMIPFGPIAERLKEGQNYFYDEKQTAAWIVTLPQPLPVSEALELRDALLEEKISMGGLILNRCPSNPFTADEQDLLELALSSEGTGGAGFILERIKLFQDAKKKLGEALSSSGKKSDLWIAPEVFNPLADSDFMNRIVRQKC
ncbi:MAG: AAA family ATPase [Bdellovibrionales bacterium]|nr:AAA family ATPase [Oligoflexia bacterium]